MKKYFELNGIKYEAKEIGFNEVADLQDMGVDLFGSRNALASVRGYVAICMGVTLEEAGKEIEKEIVSNGVKIADLITEIATLMTEKVAESDFFRTITQIPTEEVAKNTRKKKAE